jgi:uncharacterized MAPEG superfamily protein
VPLAESYGHAIAALALWGLLVVLLGNLSTLGREEANRAPCGKPKRNYADPWYRRERAFANAIETSPGFLATALAAILAGAPSFWVNLFAALFLVARVAMAGVHIYTQNQPWRSAFFGFGWLFIILLGLLALGAIFL